MADMLSSLLRPKKPRRRPDDENDNEFFPPYEDRRATADFTEDDGEDEPTEDEEDQDDDNQDEEEDEEGGDDEDGEEDTPLLPIFSAAHLDALPVYNLTHAIRLIVLPRTETTLTWDQLRSPQVSQFLVKPMQQQIRTSHFSRATLYALMANCLQFEKEAQANPGNAGNSKTRAMVCELLAIKLLKEYNTRELIDALSYDFFPLQGIAPEISLNGQVMAQKNRPAAARISTLEVAIRASAKRFIAHPVVVRQLEAIWAGTIVFHSAADNLHRRGYAATTNQDENSDCLPRLVPDSNARGYESTNTSNRARPSNNTASEQYPLSSRRTVTLYDPRDASLFKLSRLRVPRYRQFFSTCSFAILLGLFLAVLSARSTDITTLEIVFWFWSAGFMLDEVVGFNEQGFSLYIMSFWNTFDLGILLLLAIYYFMRLYGIFLVDVGRHQWNSMAYDVLATTAILLFPRLFSVLDHYRYFSQLLIAFRLMAMDLVAVFILILIACSGFFVAFTFSFGKNEYSGAQVAYKIFQILMGFTPAAWEAWETYNPLGKALLVLFLFICHFLVVTILITVLTNSFMAIVSNADQEHQFVFAVNTISMVKNDALFSYVAPSNIFAWLLTPIRSCIPFRLFIKTNRNVIKATHFPLLFSIFAYEKLFLARSVFEPTDLVDNVRRGKKRMVSFQEPKMALFSPSIRLRQESVAGMYKDRALDEVFRLAPRPGTLNRPNAPNRSRTLKVVNNWMDQSGVASPPMEQDRDIVDRLEMRRQSRRATMRRRISGNRSIASDPAEFMSTTGLFPDIDEEGSGRGQNMNIRPDDIRSDELESDAEGDGDDELNTHDDDEVGTFSKAKPSYTGDSDHPPNSEGYFRPQTSLYPVYPKLSSSESSHPKRSPPLKLSPPRRHHGRNMSTNTILYNPLENRDSSASPPRPRPNSRPQTVKGPSNPATGTHTPLSTGSGPHQSSCTPRASQQIPKSKPRPILPGRQNFQSVPNFTSLDAHLGNTNKPNTTSRTNKIRHRRSSLSPSPSLGLSDPENNPSILGAVPSSFQTQMALATGELKRRGGNRGGERDGEGMMGRLMLARMKTLEEGFAEVVREVRGMGLSRGGSRGGSSYEGEGGGGGGGSGVGELGGKGKGRERIGGAGLKPGGGERRKKSSTGGGDVKRTTSAVDFAEGGVGMSGVRQTEEPQEYGEGELPEMGILKGKKRMGSSV